MSLLFDIILLFAVIAAVWKLRSILGRRTGFERKKSADMPDMSPDMSNVNNTAFTSATEKHATPTGKPPLTIVNEVKESARQGIDAIAKKDKNFSAPDFLKGARAAYKLIVEAFAKGDMEELNNLSRQNVAERFQAEIERRNDKEHQAHALVKKILEAQIILADLKTTGEKEEAQITVAMKSNQIAWIKDKEGRIIAGDPNTPREMKDVWTFARILNTKDPNWSLIATGV